jgi:ABC-2 type transport system permease protein
MNGFGAILRRELELAFRSPVAWVAMVAFHAFNGFAWRDLVSVWQESARAASSAGSVPVHDFAEAVLTPYFLGLAFALVVFLPFLTMRTLAEERRSGFEDLLHSLSLTPLEILGGKLGALAVQLGLLVVPATLLPWTLAGLAPVPVGVVLSGGLGALLLGVTAVAIGVWASSLTENQPVAATLTLGLLLFLFFVDRFWEPATAVSLRSALEPFGHGAPSLRAATLFAVMAAGFAWLSARGLHDRRTAG